MFMLPFCLIFFACFFRFILSLCFLFVRFHKYCSSFTFCIVLYVIYNLVLPYAAIVPSQDREAPFEIGQCVVFFFHLIITRTHTHTHTSAHRLQDIFFFRRAVKGIKISPSYSSFHTKNKSFKCPLLALIRVRLFSVRRRLCVYTDSEKRSHNMSLALPFPSAAML